MLGLGRPQSGWAPGMGQGTGASTPLQELQLPLAAPSYSKKLDKEKKNCRKKKHDSTLTTSYLFCSFNLQNQHQSSYLLLPYTDSPTRQREVLGRPPQSLIPVLHDGPVRPQDYNSSLVQVHTRSRAAPGAEAHWVGPGG